MNLSIVKAIDFFGSQKVMSEKLSIKQQNIHAWMSNKRKIPPKRCVQIEQLTNGAVTRKDLRPDDWHLIWIELAEKEAAQDSGSLKDD